MFQVRVGFKDISKPDKQYPLNYTNQKLLIPEPDIGGPNENRLQMKVFT